jgi:hypothetical protein
MTHPPLADVPVRSAADLTRRWATLLDPPVFSARSLWLAWLDTDGRMLPIVVPVDELPPLPEWSTLSGLLTLHDAVAEQTGWAEGHLALALCRPGPAAVLEDDAEWADALESELDGMLDGTWSLHLAAAGRVLPVVSPPWSGRAGTTRSSTLR